MSETHWTDRLSDYLDGGLTPEEHSSLEAHLGTCAECAHVLDEQNDPPGQARAPARVELGISVAGSLDPTHGSPVNDREMLQVVLHAPLGDHRRRRLARGRIACLLDLEIQARQ